MWQGRKRGREGLGLQVSLALGCIVNVKPKLARCSTGKIAGTVDTFDSGESPDSGDVPPEADITDIHVW